MSHRAQFWAVLTAGVVVAAIYAEQGRWATAGVFVLTGAALGVTLRPQTAAVTHRSLLDIPIAQRRVVVYYRPACPVCQRLWLALWRVRKEVIWVNVRRDHEASVFVRGVNNGDVTVPTVVIDGVAHTNPPPGLVRTALSSSSRR